MKKLLSLTKLYINSVYGISGAVEKMKGDRKAKLKAIGFGLLMLYAFGAIAVIFVLMNLGTYDAYKSIGQAEYLLINGVVISVALGFVFSFITAITTYYVGGLETNLLAFPLRPIEIFAPKFLMTYISNFIISGCFFGVMVVVWAIKENPNILFYVYSLAFLVVLPLIPLSLAYCVIVPLIRFGRFMRKKETLVMIGSVFGILIAVAFQVFYQSITSRLQDKEWIIANLGTPGSFGSLLSGAYPPAALAQGALAHPDSLAGALSALGLIALSLAVAAIAIVVLARPYAASLPGFGDVIVKKLERAGEYLKSNIRSRPLFGTLFMREVRLMNREPSFLVNGPLVMLLMPLILAVVVMAQWGRISAQLGDFTKIPGITEIATLIAVGLGAFLGGSTQVACTAFSREGQGLFLLKAMPLDPKALIDAKLAYAMLLSLIGCVFGVLPFLFLIKLPLANAVLAFVASLAYNACLNIAALALDFSRPKLEWDNPIAALKQNTNAVLITVGNMALIGALVAGIILTGVGLIAAALGIAIICGIGTCVLYPMLARYSRRRLRLIE